MVAKLINKLVYPIHVKFQSRMEHIEVRRRLVTFSDDISVL